MKTTLLISTLLLGTVTFAAEADSTGLEGDHLDLSAVLAIFKESESPEDFEKKLNTESSNVNNLDLNEDGEVDYIRVIDSGDSTAHVLTLQVPVNENESQDVATIELEETDQDVVQVQIVGDEELYGEDYVLLPQSAGRGPVVINVIAWRPVRFMWGPRYRFWVSPWRYRAYPGWYRPWKRRTWRGYRGHVVVYRGGCRRVYRRSFTRAHVVHYRRTTSVTFHKVHHHKHVSKTASTKKSTGSTTKTASKKQSGTAQKMSTPQTKAAPSKQKAVSQQAQPAQASGTKTSTSKSKSKAQATPTKSAAPSPQKSVTKKQATRTKSSSSSARKRPGATKTKSTNARQRSGTSSGRTRSKSAGRSAGGKRN